MDDYNKTFDTNYSLATFDAYFKDVSKKVKNAVLTFERIVLY